MLNEPTDVIDGLKVGPLLIGEFAYPACIWLMKPYLSNANLSSKEKLNKSLCSTRVPVERIFLILKARWRLSCLDHNKENVANVITTCCILSRVYTHLYINGLYINLYINLFILIYKQLRLYINLY